MIKSIKRNIKYWFQRRTRGWSDDETWNLDWEFFRWVNSRFKQYRKDASDIVDLEFYKFKYKGKEYTQLELINRIIKLTNKLIDEDYFMGKLILYLVIGLIIGLVIGFFLASCSFCNSGAQ